MEQNPVCAGERLNMIWSNVALLLQADN